ncbi:hypothetical protein O1M63_16180 [Streptomyces mirabilis]|nr:hypothetical protein [Streptomyces mirabilis]
MAEHVRVRKIDDDEGRRLLRIIRTGTGSVVTWRQAQMVLLSPQGMAVADNAEVTFTSADRVRDVIHEAEQWAVDRLRDDLSSGRWAERNRDLVALDTAELGLRLLLA